jgi:hypothetical protein
MSARSDLAGLIEAVKPATWTVYPYPANLGPFEDSSHPVAIVIEQRTILSGATSPDDNGIPVGIDLIAWVVVDGTRGDSLADTEDLLEQAAEQMIRILEPLPTHVWDGTAARDQYDPQKPAYQFPIRAAGALTPEE